MIWPLPSYQASSTTTSYFHSMPSVLFKDLSVSRKHCVLLQLLQTLTPWIFLWPLPSLLLLTLSSTQHPARHTLQQMQVLPSHVALQAHAPTPSCYECWLQGPLASPGVPLEN